MSLTLPDRIVLFDGDCAVCDTTVKWLIAHDPQALLAYAPLQGSTAAQIRAQHADWPTQIDSIIFVDSTQGTPILSWYSTGFLHILGHLPAPWRSLASLRFVPRFLRDGCYRLFARYRKRIFGTASSCRLPTPNEAKRLLP